MAKTVDMTKYMPRIIDGKLENRLELFGAVSIEGPEGCGKTSAAERVCKSEVLLEDPDGNCSTRRAAEADIMYALEGEEPRLIDEWEHVPALWDGVRQEVDRRTGHGHFVLTMSFRPLDLTTRHTGIGRIARLKMGTMTLYETGDSTGEISLEAFCEGGFEPVVMSERMTLKRLAHRIVRGGWPDAADDDPCPSAAAERRISGIVGKCADNRDGVRYNAEKMTALLRSLARHDGEPVTVSRLIGDIPRDEPGQGKETSLNRLTAQKYIDFLERAYLLEDTHPYITSPNPSERIRHGERRRLCDTSLACALLRVTEDDLINDIGLFERLFKCLCEHDLKAYAESFGANVSYHMDYNSTEGIDAVVELRDGRWYAFETRLSASQIDPACRLLERSCKTVEGHFGEPPRAMCVVCGMLSAAYRRSEDGIFVVPLTSLRP